MQLNTMSRYNINAVVGLILINHSSFSEKFV